MTATEDDDVQRMLAKKASAIQETANNERLAREDASHKLQQAENKRQAAEQAWASNYEFMERKVKAFQASANELGAGAHIFKTSPSIASSPFTIQVESEDKKFYADVIFRLTDDFIPTYKILQNRGVSLILRGIDIQGNVNGNQAMLKVFTDVFEAASVK